MKIASAVCMAAALAVGAAAAAAGPANEAAEAGPAAAAGSTGSDTPRDTPRSGGGLDEVVVTAEKRSTNLQQTAVAASVLSGSELLDKGILTVNQLQTVMPSVVIENFGQGNDFNIRGIGKGEHNTQTSTGVITYRDGVAAFPGYFQDEPFYDIDSLQVLLGPQGTFAGENSTGGAVYISEKAPSLHGTDGYLLAQYGNYNDAMLQGAVNLPLSDTVAARVAFYDEYRDSFYHITGPFTGGDGSLKETGVRFSLLWQPSDALTVIWRNDYAYVDSGGYPADPAIATNDLFHITANGPQLAIDQFGRSTLNIDYKLENGFTLRSITGAQFGRTAYDGDLDGTSLTGLTFKDGVDEQLLSQEFDLISPEKGFMTYVLGAYYQNNRYRFPIFDEGLPPGVFDYSLDGVNVTDNAAAFAQLSFHLTSRLQLQIGGRYSYNDSTNRVNIYEPEIAVHVPDHQFEHDDRPTGKVSLDFQANASNFLYAFVATGYKPGGLNVPSPGLGASAPFRSEYVVDYEVGWKATAFGDHLRTRLGGYYNDFKSFQVITDNPTAPSITLEVNDPSVTRLYGLEASAQGVFGDLSFDLGAAVEHSSLGSFFATDFRYAGAAGLPLCNPVSGPATLVCVNLQGHPQTYAPEVTVNLGANYRFHLSQGSTLTPSVNFSHIGSQYGTLFDNASMGDYLGVRNLLQAQLAWQRGEWNIAAYGMNLTDEHYVSAILTPLRLAGNPRQFGLRVTKLF